MAEGSSPASSGPAGSLFEAQVGGYYLLTLLVGGEPRGLPGAGLDRVEFQRAGEGHYLDDVILRAHDAQGRPAVLEIQVKRGVTFAPRDPIFRSVIEQIAKAVQAPDFFANRSELAIAISRNLQKIDGAYQDLLAWARQVNDAATFMNRVNRPGAGNQDMRTFVETCRTHLREFGVSDDDLTMWWVLRRLQILVFDFTAQGSATEQLVRERAVRALRPEEAGRAGELSNILTAIALRIAAAGGDCDRSGLLEQLREYAFGFAAERRNSTARASLAEASGYVLADIGDRVGTVKLFRQERIAGIRAALDAGRYLEIRGNAGVGKSVILRHFAEQMAAEAPVIALSPSRIIPRGWTAMKGVLGVDGTAHEFLADLAADGSAALFVDNLDFYGVEERRTVIDLVREAAKVPGFYVIVTARTDFGITEPNWLPEDALAQLASAEPVVIDDLTTTETDDLRNASPAIAALLAENHPARAVARNLFRLARLVRRPSDENLPRTEVEMARQWWETGDGAGDQGYRDRTRLLIFLAEQTIGGAERLDVSGQPAAAIDALIMSETLRDLGNDRVGFRHDVLRDWAVANFLVSAPASIEGLALDRPAPASLVRGFELAARMAIEFNDDPAAWHSLLLRVSGDNLNGSWRRAVLLALVRSERAPEVLERVAAFLLQDRGGLLRELIRVVMATEVESATKRFAAAGIMSKLIPAGLNLPDGLSWTPLLIWIVRLGARLPASSIPEVVDLYTAWSMGFLGQDPVTPLLLVQLYGWLAEIESARNVERTDDQRVLFNGELSAAQISAVAGDLRIGFLAFCNRTPALAAQYLEALRKRRHRDPELRDILKFRGALAQAVPKELAELTAELLISAEKDDEERGSPFREPFGYANLDFVPASPSQGPFLELLIHAPEHGLRLVRQLVDHSVSFRSRGRAFGTNAIRIPVLNRGEMVFPWIQCYGWSRDIGAGPTIVTSALMALEASAHGRIDAGETVDKVIADVIGLPNAPAAYLLVVVDLLLSHWPKSAEAAVPFVACPELLCLDNERSIADGTEFPDILGIGELRKEPVGLASVESLKARPSRRSALESLLRSYALEGSNDHRARVAELLRKGADRLGPPAAESTLGDPEFMVVHALNLVDPNNWREASRKTEEGLVAGWEYVAPAAEVAHLTPLQDAARERQASAAMRRRIGNAFQDARRSSPAFAVAALTWAQGVSLPSASVETETDESTEKPWMRYEAIITAALIAVRDGDDALIASHFDWIRSTFECALKAEEDPVHRVRTGLKFNPVAIAFAGMAVLLKRRFNLEDARILIEAAGSQNPAGARGFAATAVLIDSTDTRLTRAVLRCAFAASIHVRRSWRQAEQVYDAQIAERRKQVESFITAEMDWLAGRQTEPQWPTLPIEAPSSRRRDRRMERAFDRDEDATPQPILDTDLQAAALWLNGASGLFDVTARPWLRDIERFYAHMTYTANGAGFDERDDVDRPPREWNAAYFDLLANCLPGLSAPEIDDIALTHITALPEDSFYDVTRDFLGSVDRVFFNRLGLAESQAVYVRASLAQSLMKTYGWMRHVRERSTRIEMRLGPAVAALFFNDYYYPHPPKCYLRPDGIDLLDPFLGVVSEAAQHGTFTFAALVCLNLLEVSPRPTHLPLINAAASAWMVSHADDKTFWVEADIGRRLCGVMAAIHNVAPQAFDADDGVRRGLDQLLAALVRLGIADAYRLEEALRSR